MTKYFRNIKANVIEAVENKDVIAQMEKHTETYEPCDEKGKSLKKEAEAPKEAQKEAPKAEAPKEAQKEAPKAEAPKAESDTNKKADK